MVRAIPVNQFWRADFLERIRPGFALSAALHVGLLMALAYYLAFRPAVVVPPDDPGPVFTMVNPPAPPPKPPTNEQTSTFHQEKAPPIEGVITTVKPFVLPPEENFHRDPGVITDQPPAPPVVINPQPIYRGGLVYPDRAVEHDVSGYVDFDFVIEPDGSVGDPQVTAEVPDGYGFAASAKKAFPHWRFKPQLVDGKPVAAPAHIRVVFKLN